MTPAESSATNVRSARTWLRENITITPDEAKTIRKEIALLEKRIEEATA